MLTEALGARNVGPSHVSDVEHEAVPKPAAPSTAHSAASQRLAHTSSSPTTAVIFPLDSRAGHGKVRPSPICTTFDASDSDSDSASDSDLEGGHDVRSTRSYGILPKTCEAQTAAPLRNVSGPEEGRAVPETRPELYISDEDIGDTSDEGSLDGLRLLEEMDHTSPTPDVDRLTLLQLGIGTVSEARRMADVLPSAPPAIEAAQHALVASLAEAHPVSTATIALECSSIGAPTDMEASTVVSAPLSPCAQPMEGSDRSSHTPIQEQMGASMGQSPGVQHETVCKTLVLPTPDSATSSTARLAVSLQATPRGASAGHAKVRPSDYTGDSDSDSDSDGDVEGGRGMRSGMGYGAEFEVSEPYAAMPVNTACVPEPIPPAGDSSPSNGPDSHDKIDAGYLSDEGSLDGLQLGDSVEVASAMLDAARLTLQQSGLATLFEARGAEASPVGLPPTEGTQDGPLMPPAEPQPFQQRLDSDDPKEMSADLLEVGVSIGVPGVGFAVGPEENGPTTGAMTVVDNGYSPSEGHNPEPCTSSREMPVSIHKQRKSAGVSALSDDRPMGQEDAPVPHVAHALSMSAADGQELVLQPHAEERRTAQQPQQQPPQRVEKQLDELHRMRLRYMQNQQLQAQAILSMLNRFPGPVESSNQVKAQPALLLAHTTDTFYYYMQPQGSA